MSKTCDLTGKKAGRGNSRSHSNIATKRQFNVNLQKKRVLNPATGAYLNLTLSAKAIRTIKKWQKEGKRYDLAALVSAR